VPAFDKFFQKFFILFVDEGEFEMGFFSRPFEQDGVSG
jgi:hypothetical protein